MMTAELNMLIVRKLKLERNNLCRKNNTFNPKGIPDNTMAYIGFFLVVVINPTIIISAVIMITWIINDLLAINILRDGIMERKSKIVISPLGARHAGATFIFSKLLHTHMQ
jgi:hypothetical protein